MNFKLLKRFLLLTLMLVAVSSGIVLVQSVAENGCVYAAIAEEGDDGGHSHAFVLYDGSRQPGSSGHYTKCSCGLKGGTTAHTFLRASSVKCGTAFNPSKCTVCGFVGGGTTQAWGQKHTYNTDATEYRSNGEEHSTRWCTRCKVYWKDREECTFGEDHICEVCKFEFNLGKDFNGLTYNTHRFNDVASCVVCRTKLAAVGGSYRGLTDWAGYTPYNSESGVGDAVTIETNYPPYNEDGKYGEFQLNCTGFRRCTAAWHKEVAAELDMSETLYIDHLYHKGMVGIGGATVKGTVGGTTITFSPMPSGRYNSYYSSDIRITRYWRQKICKR